MAPRKSRGAAAPPVTAVQVRRLTRTLDRVMQALDAQSSALEQIRDDQNLQFKRIAQLQVELDLVKQTLTKLTGNLS